LNLILHDRLLQFYDNHKQGLSEMALLKMGCEMLAKNNGVINPLGLVKVQHARK